MGSVGLSFGSPTSGTGFDVATTVAALVANLQATETPYKTQLTAFQAQDTVISNLGSLMSTLSTDVQNLADPTGVLSSLEGSSSNTNVLALTSAGTGAVAGSHTVYVTQLAQTSSTYASSVAATDTLSGSLSIQVGTGSAVNVAVTSGETVSQFAATINQAGAGVTATVIQGSSGEQLSLTSSTSGQAGNITVNASSFSDATTGHAITFSVGQAGQDANLEVDGVQATSSSNTVTSVIPGVTFQLLDTTTPSTPVQVLIENNTASVGTAVSTLVTDYNAVVNALSAQEGSASSGSAQPFYGNPLIATLQEGLSNAVAVSQGSGTSALNLSTIGISLNQNGTLSLDTDTLNSALSSNFSGVVGLFQNANGVGQTLETETNALGNGQSTGLLALAAKGNTSQETDLNATLKTLDANIATKQNSLTAELNAANQELQSIPEEIQNVNELYSAITGYGQSTNG